MSADVLRARFARGLELARDHAAMLGIFAAALFASALLLFSVQPVFARMVLPKLGGSPAVWAVSMVFFQAVLLAGYGYAHLVNRHCPQRYAPLLHLGLMAAATLALPFGLPAFANEPPAGDAYLWLIGVLAAGVGLPFFAVSANAPLLQSWFARSGHPQASDPYFLYGASNFGSLIALLAYPLCVEPVLGLAAQATVWTYGFVCLAGMIALCGLLVMPMAAIRPAAGAGAVNAQRSGWGRRLQWVWLAAVPSGLLVSFTSYVTTDIASAPFLWVVPLAVFLGTFIVVFRATPLVSPALMLRAQPVLVAMTVLGLATSTRHSWLLAVAAGFGAFVVTTLVCHRELYERRPASAELTAFYMWMSLGGVLGGIFAAIAAPQLFDAIYEFPLLLLAGLFAREGLGRAFADAGERRAVARQMLAGAAAVGLSLGLSKSGLVANGHGEKITAVVVAASAVYMLINIERPLRQAGVAVVLGLSLLLLPSNMNFGFAERSFFGVHRVSISPDGNYRMLFHGTTLHGAMRIRDDAGKPVPEPLPATYYHPLSPMARGVEAARHLTGKSGGGLVVGSVGVGAGSMACYARADETWRFYEIDPVVVKLARDPANFTFFSRCRPNADFVIGDARLTLAKEPAGLFDYLVIDAFSSDSIPVHLLTREAMALYLSKVSPKGLLALHVSNLHMELAGVAADLVRSLPGAAGVIVADRPKRFTFDGVPSDVVLVAKSPEVLAAVAQWPGAKPIIAAEGGRGPVPWTDDYSNVLAAILKRKGW